MGTIARIALVLVGLALYLGLAIAGWGGWQPFFSYPALVSLTVVTFGLAGLALLAGGNLSSGQKEDRGNRWVLAAFSAIGLLLGYLPAYCDRTNFWTIGEDKIRWLGVVLFGAGGAFRVWPVFVLGNRFSGLVAIQAGHTLVTTGIYRFIRNPSYLGLLVSTLGWALAFRSGVGVILTALMIPPLIARMHSEEKLLSAHFGADYDAYRARTWRVLPGIY